jgi:hypothetical protein
MLDATAQRRHVQVADDKPVDAVDGILEVVGMHQVADRRADQVAGVPAMDRPASRADVAHDPELVGHRDGVGAVLHDRRVTGVRQLDGPSLGLLGGEVFDLHDAVPPSVQGVAGQRQVNSCVEDRPVDPDVSRLETAATDPAFDHGGDGLDAGRQIVRVDDIVIFLASKVIIMSAKQSAQDRVDRQPGPV